MGTLFSTGAGRSDAMLTNKSMNWRAVLVNTRVTDVLRATDTAGGAPDRDRRHTQRLLTGAKLQDVARYAEALAEHKAREARLVEESEDDEQLDERPDDVPSKATITIKEINDNRCYYWQWRDSDKNPV
jgi:hypothetical protein